ncbi:MAG: protein kinase [Acidobacteria bacterium]|uniref:non-specific serine/threonine protein kinase n=1 Tax=Candidatus Sulfomarinibacter kjeldsenii TaxID=2885994 RepID=A0A8J6XY42_9BACT|nr:protein kinase [Candidatus Sulfomarinibacter kjeldsenii]
MSIVRANPYVVGQWVRGERFYGRSALIDEILTGPRNSLWVLGTRRIGKTSLLKQLEHLTSSEGSGYVPIFWDLQGADDPNELNLTFADALLDAEDRLDAIGIDVSSLEDEDLFQSMARLRRTIRGQGNSLLLLCDEVEELLNLHRQDPALLRKLRRAMQSQDGVRSVLTSSVRLCELSEQRGDTSPFLHGFSPPLYISGLSTEESLALVRQNGSPEETRPEIESGDAIEICHRCDHHPYLIQLVCKRFVETGDLEEACRQVVSDRMINYFFSVDFEMLSSTEKSVLRLIADQGTATDESIHAVMKGDTADRDDALQRLENLGFVGRDEGGNYVVPSYFLIRWLEDLAITQPPAQAASLYEEPTISIRTIDSRYTLHEEIGAGATGSVFKARDALLDTWVAVKLLKPEYTANRNAIERVRQEIVLSRDIAHPNILRVYHLASYEGGTYLTMQWIKGGTLADVIAERGALPTSEVLTLATKLSSALAAAHGLNILHRDIKPGNILVDEKGEPFLADFGLARLIGGHGLTQHGVFVGTPHYCSPEQVALEELDERSDIYALGLVIYEMATGRRPFEAETVAEILAMQKSALPPNPASVSPQMPGELAAIILRCLAKNPLDRIASARELEEALDRITEAF